MITKAHPAGNHRQLHFVHESKIISKDGSIIALEKSGRGPAIILVDGAMAYRELFGGRRLAAKLSTDFTVITYDRRGRGESTDSQVYAVEREIEDIGALIDTIGGSAYLYGFSSGSVLALKAAAKLGAAKVTKLVIHQPPLDSGDDEAKQQFAEFTRHMSELLAENRRGDAVALFFADMIPAEQIKEMRQSPEWPLMEAVAHTLAYDNAVLGDGAIPLADANAATMPALVLGSDANPASDSLARAMPHAQRKTLEVQENRVPPEELAPVLREFFRSL